MHYTHTVAISGDVSADKLADALDELMSRFDENLEVPLHRDTSVYAEPFDVQLAKAKASNRDGWTDGLTDTEIVEQWDGGNRWDVDGWPMTMRNPDGQWDYWRIGGRWSHAWVLKGGVDNGPLQPIDNYWDSPPLPDHNRQFTDNARKRDIEPESIKPTYSWLDLAGEWHTKWIGPTREEATKDPDESLGDTSHWRRKQKDHDAEFMMFLANLPVDTWLVHIDCHN